VTDRITVFFLLERDRKMWQVLHELEPSTQILTSGEGTISGQRLQPNQMIASDAAEAA